MTGQASIKAFGGGGDKRKKAWGSFRFFGLDEEPLTLALSRRERGLAWCGFKITTHQLPLLPGEGWGEGKRCAQA